jgi:ribosome-binding protein aMBF1 (putative translation factor)
MINKFNTWASFKKESLKDPLIRREYERLAPEYEIIKAIIEARTRKNFTQANIAKKIGTTQSAIARVESGTANPSLKFMHRLADALGLRLSIRFLPQS